MACYEDTATGVKELFDKTVVFLTTPANFTGGNEWDLVYPSVYGSATTEVILKGKGSGKDSIYIGLKIEDSANARQQDIVLNGYAGFDPNLGWEEQPGAINHDKLPIIPMAENVYMSFFVTANSSRIVIVIEMSTQYESAYLGFMKPVAIDRQYPYPLVVAGSYIQGGKWSAYGPGHSAFISPGSDTYAGIGKYTTVLPVETGQEETSPFRLRRPDGRWRSALNINSAGQLMGFEKLCLWPYNTGPKDTYTVYRKVGAVSKLEDNMLFPIKLYESHPVGNVGILDGVYFLGNRTDLAAKDTVIYKDKLHRVFSNVHRRDDDAYFCIEWW